MIPMLNAQPPEIIHGLPGADLIVQGMADAASGQVTAPACLVSIAAPRLLNAGLLTPTAAARLVSEPELTLYRLLRTEPGDAFSRYNAFLRQLVSFEHALDHRRRG